MATGWALLAALIATGLFAASPAVAATDDGSDGSYDVNSTADVGDANTADNVCDTTASTEDGDCTLRAAIDQSNANTVDVVNVPTASSLGDGDGAYDLTLGQLQVTDNLTLNGAGQADTIVDAGRDSRILKITGETPVTVNGMTFQKGFHDDRGGAVKVRDGDSELVMNDSTITDSGRQGENLDFTNHGGGLYVEGGKATLNRTTVNGNIADDEGGGIGVGAAVALPQTLVLNDTVVSGNIAINDDGPGNGGGIYNDSDGEEPQNEGDPDPAGLQVNGGSVVDNRAANDGGGIWNSGEAAVNGTRVDGNTADSDGEIGDGGGIWNGKPRIVGSSHILGGGGELTVNDALISNNISITGEGGGIANETKSNASVDETAVRDNGATGGGGILNRGEMQLTNSEVSGNGGQKEGQEDEEPVPLQPVTVTTQNGGGILNDRSFSLEVPLLEATNLTLSTNTAIEGGGLYNSEGPEQPVIPGPAQNSQIRVSPTVHLRYATVANNRATDGEGGGIFNGEGFNNQEIFAEPGMVTLEGTLLAANREGGPENCGGRDPESAGNNLEDSDTCDLNSSAGDGDIVNGNPGIAGLADNGGPTIAGGGTTHTHALLDGSQAIDGATVAAAAKAFSQAERQGCPPRDQRNISRPQGPACDIGAYERLVQQVPPGPENETPGVTTAGPRACVSRRSFLLRVNVTGLTREQVSRVDVFLDGRRIARRTQAQFTVRVRVSRLSRRRVHRIRVVATDESGDQASQTRRFRRCRRPAFTG